MNPSRIPTTLLNRRTTRRLVLPTIRGMCRHLSEFSRCFSGIEAGARIPRVCPPGSGQSPREGSPGILHAISLGRWLRALRRNRPSTHCARVHSTAAGALLSRRRKQSYVPGLGHILADLLQGSVKVRGHASVPRNRYLKPAASLKIRQKNLQTF